MTKIRRFNISQNLERGMRETISAVTDNAGQARFEVVSLDRIETDPENPRELTIMQNDMVKGLNKQDEAYYSKAAEQESLMQLADTIKKKGLINPIVIYRHGEKYRLVAGERRFLASLIAGKRNIQARILNERPKIFDLRLLQWIENTEREDLSLRERLGNLQAIIHEYKKDNPQAEATASLIKDLIGVSLSQATYYLAALSAPIDVMEQIKNGRINNLDKAAIISKIPSMEVRKKAIDTCINGSSLKQIKSLINMETKHALSTYQKSKSRGRPTQRINMGSTTKSEVVRKIINSVLQQPNHSSYTKLFANVDWKENKATTLAFRKLIELLEKESG
jgi:ParB family chromosome partitioning protein